MVKPKTAKAKKVRQEQEEDKGPKEIYIPGTVTVGQLAKICGKKLCESFSSIGSVSLLSVNLQRIASRLGMGEDQQRSDYSTSARTQPVWPTSNLQSSPRTKRVALLSSST
jgi:hypothetical protein